MDPETGVFPPQLAIPQGTNTVFFLAQSPRYRAVHDRPTHVLEVNTVSPVHVATVAARAGVTRFIYASTGSVYAPGFAACAETAALRRDAWYELSKVHAEEALALFRDQLDVTAVRLFGVYGPGQSGRLVPTLASSVASGKPIIIEQNPMDASDLDGLRISLCYVDDAVRILAALQSCQQTPVINVAGPEVLNIRQMAMAIGKAMGCTPSFEVTSRARAGDLVANIDLLKRLLQPNFTPFEVGLRQTLRDT